MDISRYMRQLAIQTPRQQQGRWQLVAAGADVRAQANNGRESLHVAAGNQNAEAAAAVIEKLVAAGSDVRAKSADGKEPLHYAAANKIKKQQQRWCRPSWRQGRMCGQRTMIDISRCTLQLSIQTLRQLQRTVAALAVAAAGQT